MNLTKNAQEKCVMARVMRQKKMHQRNFTLKGYGTWEKATRAAKRWIDKILRKLPPKIRSKGLMTRRNHSGVVGVHWSPGIVKKRNGNVYECPRWIARWVGCPYNGGVSWMERQFEHEGAFVLAVLSRQLETVNRDEILMEFQSILGRKNTMRSHAKWRCEEFRSRKSARDIMRKDKGLNGDLDRLPWQRSAAVPGCEFQHRLGARNRGSDESQHSNWRRDAAGTRRRGRLRYVHV